MRAGGACGGLSHTRCMWQPCAAVAVAVLVVALAGSIVPCGAAKMSGNLLRTWPFPRGVNAPGPSIAIHWLPPSSSLTLAFTNPRLVQ